jgi:hypothetical protein
VMAGMDARRLLPNRTPDVLIWINRQYVLHKLQADSRTRAGKSFRTSIFVC